MAKIAFAVTEVARGAAGFDNLTANTKVFTRAYIGTNGQLKFETKSELKTVPSSTKAVYSLDAHKTANGRILFPTKSVAELRTDLVKDKIVSSKDAEFVKPGKFGNFWFDAEGAAKK